MPRPRNPQETVVRKERNWSIVLHNFDTSGHTKKSLEVWLTEKWTPRQYVIAEEKYNHQEGTHVHLFLTLKNQVYFNSLLKELERYMMPKLTPLGMVRRVDLKISKATDLWHGCAYVLKDKNKTQKDKNYDDSAIIFLDKKNAVMVDVEPQAKQDPVESAKEILKEMIQGTWWAQDPIGQKKSQETFRREWCVRMSQK